MCISHRQRFHLIHAKDEQNVVVTSQHKALIKGWRVVRCLKKKHLVEFLVCTECVSRAVRTRSSGAASKHDDEDAHTRK